MKKRKYIKLNKIERALLTLAEHIERNPYNEYRVRQEVSDILGIEEIKAAPKTNPLIG